MFFSFFTLYSFSQTDGESQHKASHSPKLQPFRFSSKHGYRLAYVFKHGCKFAVSPRRLHIVGRLHIYPHMGRNARCRLNLQCIFSRYRTFSIHNLVKHGVRHTDKSGELSLRHAASLQLVFQYFAWMYWRGRLQLVRRIDFLCCFHIEHYL